MNGKTPPFQLSCCVSIRKVNNTKWKNLEGMSFSPIRGGIKLRKRVISFSPVSSAACYAVATRCTPAATPGASGHGRTPAIMRRNALYNRNHATRSLLAVPEVALDLVLKQFNHSLKKHRLDFHVPFAMNRDCDHRLKHIHAHLARDAGKKKFLGGRSKSFRFFWLFESWGGRFFHDSSLSDAHGKT